MAEKNRADNELHALSRGELVLMKAQGKALALLSSLLANHGLIDTKELEGVLDLFSCIAAENDALEADILASWARDIEGVFRPLMAPMPRRFFGSN